MRKVTIGINGLRGNVKTQKSNIEKAFSHLNGIYGCFDPNYDTNESDKGHIEITFNAHNGTDDELLETFTRALRQYDEGAYAFII